MELTARRQQRDNKDYDPLDKNWYYQETTCRWYVPFFQHTYYYTKDVEIDNWRNNKTKTDRHIIYSLLICKRLFKKTIRVTSRWPSNGDMFLIQWLAFDPKTKYYEDWKTLHNGEALDGKIPNKYTDYFDKDKEMSPQKRSRQIDNNTRFDDFYKQVVFDDFAKVISQLLKTYEDYEKDTDDFKTNMHYNKTRTEMFEKHYKYSINHFRNVIWYAVGPRRTEDSQKILDDVEKVNYSKSRESCYHHFKDGIVDPFRRIIRKR